MTTETTNNAQVVADLWFRWQETVRNIVEPRRMAKKLSPQEYRDLHGALVKACASGDETDADTAEKLQQAKRIASPWVNYESLTSADRRFLSEILRQAEPINTALRRNSSTPLKKSAPRKKRGVSPLTWILAFGIGLGVGLYVLTSDATSDMPLRYDIQRAMLRSKYMLSRFSFMQIFGAVTIVVLLIVGPLMYKTRKS
jgi:hypothetical protein